MFPILPNNKILDWSKMEACADNNINMTETLKYVLSSVENIVGTLWEHCGKRRKCWLPAFSPFPTMFSKGFSIGVVKSRDCLIKGLVFTRRQNFGLDHVDSNF